ncbi:MAG TPA: acyl-CoA dehydrogenase family protein [Xanthobacteraceae bacterium]|jgi:pimeloyl-CoA dehydrogenase small subunit|nr:acyl-CoA dehydrogenase family protein [Xanthobacteraceae bacterium]
MDFELSEEQRLLQESIGRLLSDRYGFEQRTAYMKEPGGFSRALWKQYADLGLLALPFAEEDGGIGGGPVDIMIVMEAMGRALVLEPYLATVVLAGGVLRHAGSKQQRANIVPKIGDGSLILALAHSERQSRYDLADVATSAKKDGVGYVFDGAKGIVLHGDSADKFIVSARVAGKQRDRDGIGLFLVDAKAKGVSIRGYQTIDGLRAAEVTLAGVKVGAEDVIGEPGKALPVIERVVDEAMAALSAEAVGAMAVMHEATVDYLKTRRQFGVPIGNFQVLQHAAVDILMATEQARSMAMLATMMAAEPNAVERHKSIAAAKVQIGRSGRFVGKTATQLHGGIGMTMEYKVGHYFKRVMAIDVLFGDADHHLATLAKMGGLLTAA